MGELGPTNIYDGAEVTKATRALLTVRREEMAIRIELASEDGQKIREPDSIAVEDSFVSADGVRLDIADLTSAFSELASSVYIGPFRNAINVGQGSHYDLPVGQSFIENWRRLKTGATKWQNEAVYQLTRDIREVFRFQDLDINAADDAQTLQIFIDGKSYRLTELGSGLTHFLLVLAQIAGASPAYVLIDEPELNLHPSLQLDFLTTVGAYAKVGVVFSTHSIGLARAAADRIYTVHKTRAGSQLAALEATPSLAEFLGEMSFSGYRDLGATTVLLVEGPSDVTTVQQFLRMLKKDHEIVLLPLGGATIINARAQPQLEEIRRLSDRIFALIDSERTHPRAELAADRAGFVEACEAAGVVPHVLERRAMENYLTERAIGIAQPASPGALDPFQLLSDLAPSWSKRENWRIAREMSWDELAETDLGQFLIRVSGEI